MVERRPWEACVRVFYIFAHISCHKLNTQIVVLVFLAS